MKPRICLHMIVKDEASIIVRCLRSVLPHVDAVVISDTGSTDDTIAIVRACLDERTGQQIDKRCDGAFTGRIDNLPWRGFAESRNDGLRLAREMIGPDLSGWLLFTLDADEVFEADPDFAWPTDGGMSYHVRINLDGMQFTRSLVTRADVPWRYEGVIHEDITLDGQCPPSRVLDGCLVRSFRDGARARDPDRYRKDAELLEAELIKDPNNSRNVFYLANSYRDSGQFDKALATYDRHAAMVSWDQEQWAAKHARAQLSILLGHKALDVTAAHFDAIENRPVRAETPLQFATYLKSVGFPGVAAIFEQHARRMPPTTDQLFVDTRCYPVAPRVAILGAPREDGSMPIASTMTSIFASSREVTPGAIKVFWDGERQAPVPGGMAEAHGKVGERANLTRALEWIAAGDSMGVLLADDVLFSRDWASRAEALLEAAEQGVGGAVVLSLWHRYAGDEPWLEIGPAASGTTDRLVDVSEGASPQPVMALVLRPATANWWVAEERRRREGAEPSGDAWWCLSEPCLVWDQAGKSRRFSPW